MIWVQHGSIVFVLKVERGFITRVPPIASYAKGWTEKRALEYFRDRGDRVFQVYVSQPFDV